MTNLGSVRRCTQARVHSVKRDVIITVVSSLIYWILVNRNNSIWNGKVYSIDHTVIMIKMKTNTRAIFSMN